MSNIIYKISFLLFSIFLFQSCEKSELEPAIDNGIDENQEINYKSKFPETITIPENSTDAVILNISDDNGIEKVTAISTIFEIINQNDFWYISPVNAFDYEETNSTSIKIKVIDKLGNQEENDITVNITDEDEKASIKLPITTDYYNSDGSIYLTLSYQYDDQDRVIRYDMIYPGNPENDIYAITDYSGDNVTVKYFRTQTNEQLFGYIGDSNITGYFDTTYSASDKPITTNYYDSNGSIYLTYSYKYDERDRIIRTDIIYAFSPESDYHMIYTYSNNTITVNTYITQSNELVSNSITTNSKSGKPTNIESNYYAGDVTYSTTQSFQYDEQDRVIRYDMRSSSNPNSDIYVLTTYTDNTTTVKTYETQTNELIYYTVTTYKESNKSPINLVFQEAKIITPINRSK